MEQVKKIIVISTPYSKEGKFMEEIRKYFKNISTDEIKVIELDGKINGYNADIIEIDSISCNSRINSKQKREDATLKIAGTN